MMLPAIAINSLMKLLPRQLLPTVIVLFGLILKGSVICTGVNMVFGCTISKYSIILTHF